MVFADDGSAATGQAWTPVLGRLDLLQPIQLPNIFEPFVNELPGARKAGVDFTPVFTRAAARAIHHVLRAAGDRADAAVEMEHARAAGSAFFRPDAPLFQNADEGGVEARVNRFVGKTFGQRLHAGAAAQRQHGIGLPGRLGGLLEENVVALAFDGELLDLQGKIIQFGRHA